MLLEQGSNNIDKTAMLNIVRTILLGVVTLSRLNNIVVTALFRLDALTVLLRAVGTRVQQY